MAAAGALTVPLLAACGSSASGDLIPAAASPSASVGSAPPASPTDPASNGVVEPSLPAVPATTSGPLKPANLPAPALLGKGWTTRVDAGGAEDGYVGNGTPTMKRDPKDIALTVVPFGCSTRSTLPEARYVLEDTYMHGFVDGVALRLVFASSAQASTFITRVRADRAACVHQSEAPVAFVRDAGPVVVSERSDTSTTGRSDPWTELFLVRGDQALIVSAGIFASQTSIFDANAVAARMAALSL